MKTLHQNLKLAASSKDTIARADDVFRYIDSDFESWGTDKKSPKTKETEVAVLEMDKGGAFAEIFGSISKDTDSMVLTQAQIIEFVKSYKEHLRKDGWATFFLFKVGDEFFVARVYLDSDLWPYASVIHFSSGSVWYAESRLRLVVPQLALKNADFGPSDALAPSRLKALKDLKDAVGYAESYIQKAKGLLELMEK